MTQIWTYSLASVLIVSLASFIGVITLSLSLDRLKKILIFLVSFSAGALLGDAFFHILPEIAGSYGFGLKTSLLFFAGIVVFFILEKYIHWTHCHEPISLEHPHHLASMNLFADGLHNFLDGLIIGASYLISLPLGLATTLAIILHEIPQEIGDFGVLIHSGYTKKRAILYNFLIALTAVLGTVVSLLIGQNSETWLAIILPVAFSGFIYIATADLIPELHKETKISSSAWQIVSFILGAAALFGLLFLE